MRREFTLIGPGRVGCAVSKRLVQAGFRITGIIGRDPERVRAAGRFIDGFPLPAAGLRPEPIADGQIILLAVPDDRIAAVAAAVQRGNTLSRATTLVHFSGLHPAEIMRSPQSAARLLSIHPLLPFADAQAAYEKLSHCPCALEGDSTALSLGEELVRALDGVGFRIKKEQKALYHAAACIASNFFVTLIDWARELLIACGMEAERVLPLLQPLLQTTAENLRVLGTEQALTGPIVRGDAATVGTHIQQLERTAPAYTAAYIDLARLTLALALRSERLDNARAEPLLQVLSAVKAEGKIKNIN